MVTREHVAHFLCRRMDVRDPSPIWDYARTHLHKSSAQELLQKLPQADLTSREQEAVSVYLKRRFKL